MNKQTIIEIVKILNHNMKLTDKYDLYELTEAGRANNFNEIQKAMGLIISNINQSSNISKYDIINQFEKWTKTEKPQEISKEQNEAKTYIRQEYIDYFSTLCDIVAEPESMTLPNKFLMTIEDSFYGTADNNNKYDMVYALKCLCNMTDKVFKDLNIDPFEGSD